MIRCLMFAILFFAPHIQFPGSEQSYPIRPTDVMILLAAMLSIYSAANIKFYGTKVLYALLGFFLISVVSTMWGAYYLSSLNLDTTIINASEISYMSLSAKRLVSLTICFTGFYLVAYTHSTEQLLLLKYWFYGLVFASIVDLSLYATDLPILMKRAGVSREGNFGGSYFLLSFFLMWLAARERCRFGKIGMLLSVLGIALTQSTASLTLLIFLWGLASLFVPSRLRYKIGLFIIYLFGAVILLLLFGDVIIDKFIGQEWNPNTYSRIDRLSSILSGMGMFADSPIFGVGLQGYTFALPMYTNEFIDKYFNWDAQRIANNIYVELLAEQGVIGTSFFIYLLYQVILPALNALNINVLAVLGFLSVLGSWLAFPTYTVTFHWLGFALLYRVSKDNKTTNVLGKYAS